jgi:hypothetical protein
MKTINISGLESYEITEYGVVYSHIKKRFLKPSVNNCGYYMYSLQNSLSGKRKFYMCSQLVCRTYVGDPPTPKHEVNHIDHNRMNNHYSNLEWSTHSENIQKSFKDNGRQSYWLNKSKPSPSLETKRLMSNVHKRPVIAYHNNEEVGKFDSVQDCIDQLQISRRFFNRVLKGSGGKKSSQYRFEFIPEIQ